MDGFYNPAIQDAMRQNYYGNYMQQFAEPRQPMAPQQQGADYDWWNNLGGSFNTMGQMGQGADWGSIPRAAAYGLMGPYGQTAGQMLGALAQRMQPGMPITQGQFQNMQQMIGSSPQQQMMEGFNNPDWSYNYSLNQYRPMDVEKL